MGITTFTGPVRSDNGFQEWDGNAWVPVAGGGGGTTAIVLNATEDYAIDVTNLEPGTMLTFAVSGGGNIISVVGTPSINTIDGAIYNYNTNTILEFASEFPMFFNFEQPSFVTFVFLGINNTPYGDIGRWLISGYTTR